MVKIDIHTNDIDNFLYHLRKLKEYNQLYMEIIETTLDLVETISEMVEPQVQEYETEATTEATAQEGNRCPDCSFDSTGLGVVINYCKKHEIPLEKPDELDALLDDL